VDAPLVRAYLEALPVIPPIEGSIERVRTCLVSLHNPDIRYLVATLLGPSAPAVARVAAAVLRAAGARTATLGRSLEETVLDDGPIDDALIARAGTLSASAGYQLADSAPQLGELSRREGIVILALTAFAEANERVALLLDTAVDPAEPVHAPRPDLVVIGPLDPVQVDRALALVPEGRPVVLAPLPEGTREGTIERLAKLGVPALVGDRDYRLAEREGQLELLVRDEPYVRVDPIPDIGVPELATGIATALALGALGIRMREDWIVKGLDTLRAAAVRS